MNEYQKTILAAQRIISRGSSNYPVEIGMANRAGVNSTAVYSNVKPRSDASSKNRAERRAEKEHKRGTNKTPKKGKRGKRR